MQHEPCFSLAKSGWLGWSGLSGWLRVLLFGDCSLNVVPSPPSPPPTMVVVDDCGCGRLLMLLLSPASPFPPLPLPISPPPPPTPSEPGWVEGWRWVMMVGRLWFVGCDNQWTTYNLLPTTYNLRPTTYYLQLTTYYLRHTTYYLLPKTFIDQHRRQDPHRDLKATNGLKSTV